MSRCLVFYNSDVRIVPKFLEMNTVNLPCTGIVLVTYIYPTKNSKNYIVMQYNICLKVLDWMIFVVLWVTNQFIWLFCVWGGHLFIFSKRSPQKREWTLWNKVKQLALRSLEKDSRIVSCHWDNKTLNTIPFLSGSLDSLSNIVNFKYVHVR